MYCKFFLCLYSTAQDISTDSSDTEVTITSGSAAKICSADTVVSNMFHVPD